MKLHLSLLCFLPVFAWAKPSVVVLPVDVSPASSEKSATYEKALREKLQTMSSLYGQSETATLVQGKQCKEDACMAEVALKANKSRFVLSSEMIEENADLDLGTSDYRFILKLLDVANEKRTELQDECAVCSEDEAKVSLLKLVDSLSAAFKEPAPSAESAVVAIPTTPMKVTSTPEGAEVFLDGVSIGETPLYTVIPQGEHKINVSKGGYRVQERVISASSLPLDLPFPLNAAWDGGNTISQSSGSIGATPAIPTTVMLESYEPDEHEISREFGWTLIGSGIALSAFGFALTWIDGDPSCKDGRGIRECPHVYDTKSLGIPVLGVGGGLFGAGIATLIMRKIWMNQEAEAHPQASVIPMQNGAGFMMGGVF